MGDLIQDIVVADHGGKLFESLHRRHVEYGEQTNAEGTTLAQFAINLWRAAYMPLRRREPAGAVESNNAKGITK
jgi:hypothetical protein